MTTAVDGDGIDEDLTRAVGMAMIAASRAAEHLARMRQSAARERHARAAGDAAQAQRELAAHTEVARAYFTVVTRPEYLHSATDQQIREAARQAQAWRERLPEAQRAADAATAELATRTPTPDTGDSQRAAVLAGEAEATDRRTADTHQPTAGVDAAAGQPEGWDTVGKHYGTNQTLDTETPATAAGQQAADTASAAQARPPWEAPAAAQTTHRHDAGRRRTPQSAARTRKPDVGR